MIVMMIMMMMILMKALRNCEEREQRLDFDRHSWKQLLQINSSLAGEVARLLTPAAAPLPNDPSTFADDEGKFGTC